MRYHHINFALLLLLAACSKSAPLPATTSPAASTAAATSLVTVPVLKPIDLTYGIYLARIEDHITVTPTGMLHRTLTYGKSYGPGDAAPGPSQFSERQLSSAEMAELSQVFTGWDALQDTYSGVADGPEVTISLGTKKVTGGSLCPELVWKAVEKLRSLADGTTRVAGPSTKDGV